ASGEGKCRHKWISEDPRFDWLNPKKKMNKINLITIIVGIVAVIIIVLAVMSISNKSSQVNEEIKLAKGEINIIKYCNHIGKAAVNDPKCTEFIRLYGPPKIV